MGLCQEAELRWLYAAKGLKLAVKGKERTAIISH